MHKNDTLLIGCLYRRPNSNNDNNIKLLHLINEATNLKFTKMLIMGDFNYPYINWKLENHESSAGTSLEFIENLKDNFLFLYITQPTRARQGQNPHILDLILTNEESLVQDIEYKSPLGKSDHSVIEFQINCIEEKTREHIPKLMYEKGNYLEMKTELDVLDWDSILSRGNSEIEEQWLKFKCIYHNLVSKYILTKTMCNEKAPNREENKYSKEITAAIKRKHRLWQRFLETKNGEKYNEYATARNKVKGLIRSFQANINKNIAEEVKTNPKKFWAYVNKKTKTKNEIPNLLMNQPNEEPMLTNDTSEETEVLSKFLSSVFISEPNGEIPIISINCTNKFHNYKYH